MTSPLVLPIVDKGEDGHLKSDYSIVYQTKMTTGTMLEEVKTRRIAAYVLQEYIQKATGVTLKLITEPNGDSPTTIHKNIFVGLSDGLKKLWPSLPPSQGMSPETYLIYIMGDNLILFGYDEPGETWEYDPMYGRIRTPSLSAVSRFLEVYIGARWYWPVWSPDSTPAGAIAGFGEKYNDLRETGLSVSGSPLSDTGLEVPSAFLIEDEPDFRIRDIELPTSQDFYAAGYSDGTFVSSLWKRYARWFRLNRVGTADRVWHMHYWYQLMPEGKWRQNGEWIQTPKGSRADKFFAFYNPNAHESVDGRIRGGNEAIPKWKEPNSAQYVENHQLCVSGRKTNSDNKEGVGEGRYPEVIAEVLKSIRSQVEDFYEQNKMPLRSLPIAPNDGNLHCNCDPCRRKDIGAYANPPDRLPLSEGDDVRNIGDRIFSFFNKIARQVKKEFPGLLLTTYAYQNYILPFALKRKRNNVSFLSDNLVVYTENNGYGFKYYDAWRPEDWCYDPYNNAKDAIDYIMSKWSTAAGCGRSTGRRILSWVDPYYAHVGQYVYSMPLASKEAIADLVARAKHYCYAGIYWRSSIGVNQIRMWAGHWPDKYLVARLMDDALPLNDQYVSDLIEQYSNQLKAKADALLTEYCNDLFGQSAGDYVKKFYDTINAQVAAFVKKYTNAQSYKNSWPVWVQENASQDLALLNEVFSVVREEATFWLDKADTAAGLTAAQQAHLQVVKNQWAFTTATLDFYADLAKYAGMWPYLWQYDGSQLDTLRDLWNCIATREKLVADCNSITNPDSCTITLWPKVLEFEYATPLTVEISEDSKASVNINEARNIIRSILAVLNDSPEYDLPLGPARKAVASGAVRQQWPRTNLKLSADNLWIDAFNRVKVGSEQRYYMVVINNSQADIENVKLQLNNMDPRGHRKIYCSKMVGGVEQLSEVPGYAPEIGNTETFSWQEDTSFPAGFDIDAPDFPKSRLVTDDLIFNARVGVTVLVLVNGNFGPHLLNDNPSPPSNLMTVFPTTTQPILVTGDGSYKIATWSAAYLFMQQIDDALLKPGGGGRFYIVKDDGSQKATITGNVEGTAMNQTYNERIRSGSLGSDQVISQFPNGTYHVYGALYDNDHIKTMAADKNGNLLSLKLIVG